MSEVYKHHRIEPAVYDRPEGVAFTPRASLFRDIGGETFHKFLEWPDQQTDIREEAEQLAVQLAKTAIDRGQGIG